MSSALRELITASKQDAQKCATRTLLSKYMLDRRDKLSPIQRSDWMEIYFENEDNYDHVIAAFDSQIAKIHALTKDLGEKARSASWTGSAKNLWEFAIINKTLMSLVGQLSLILLWQYKPEYVAWFITQFVNSAFTFRDWAFDLYDWAFPELLLD